MQVGDDEDSKRESFRELVGELEVVKSSVDVRRRCAHSEGGSSRRAHLPKVVYRGTFFFAQDRVSGV